MLTCEEIAALLDDVVDDELEPGLREETLAHLKKCSQCERSRAALERTLRLLRLLREDQK